MGKHNFPEFTRFTVERTYAPDEDPSYMVGRPLRWMSPEMMRSMTVPEHLDRLEAGAPVDEEDMMYGLRELTLHREQILARLNQEEI